MKPVTGRVVSSKTISLSKAARVLAGFVSTDTGSSSSSQAVSAYLKRASFSFNDLLQFHSDLKSSQFTSKSRTDKKWTPAETVNARDDGILDSFDGGKKGDERKERSGADVGVDDGYERSERKKRENVEAGDGLDNGNEDSSGVKRKRKKKRVDY
ncbi:uncharacterized protein LOC131249311 [Magnolia sinica]|uniref:uncharacterized protein LOC131249311 n=1 Tax=Magnolia sinica TaxID=86752 RepID=UPI0026585EA2|nr:uncharacterized protein LOC131249311 [Magnolia sinica]